MSTRIYAKNGYVVLKEIKTGASDIVAGSFNGRDVAVPRGVVSEGGIIELDEDRLVTSRTSHEMEVVEVGKGAGADLARGDHVIVFIGGDDGEVTANGVSAFVGIDGTEHAMVHDRFIWARVKDGEIIPRHGVILTERDDEAFRWHTMGPSSLLHAPGFLMDRGASATGARDTADAGAMYAVTALYERVVRTGPDVLADDFARGQTVCFSPSYSATKLRRRVGRETRWYHLVDSDEVFFVAY